MERLLTILFLALVFKAGLSFPHTASPACGLCPSGSRVLHECTPSAETICEPCSEGTYSDAPSSLTKCKPCTSCSQNEFIAKQCSANTDTRCADCLNAPKVKSKSYLASCEGDDGVTPAVLDPAVEDGLDSYTRLGGKAKETTPTDLFDVMMGDAPDADNMSQDDTNGKGNTDPGINDKDKETQAGNNEDPQAGTNKDPQAGTNEDPQAGTNEDPQAGTNEDPQAGDAAVTLEEDKGESIKAKEDAHPPSTSEPDADKTDDAGHGADGSDAAAAVHLGDKSGAGNGENGQTENGENGQTENGENGQTENGENGQTDHAEKKNDDTGNDEDSAAGAGGHTESHVSDAAPENAKTGDDGGDKDTSHLHDNNLGSSQPTPSNGQEGDNLQLEAASVNETGLPEDNSAKGIILADTNGGGGTETTEPDGKTDLNVALVNSGKEGVTDDDDSRVGSTTSTPEGGAGGNNGDEAEKSEADNVPALGHILSGEEINSSHTGEQFPEPVAGKLHDSTDSNTTDSPDSNTTDSPDSNTNDSTNSSTADSTNSSTAGNSKNIPAEAEHLNIVGGIELNVTSSTNNSVVGDLVPSLEDGTDVVLPPAEQSGPSETDTTAAPLNDHNVTLEKTTPGNVFTFATNGDETTAQTEDDTINETGDETSVVKGDAGRNGTTVLPVDGELSNVTSGSNATHDGSEDRGVWTRDQTTERIPTFNEVEEQFDGESNKTVTNGTSAGNRAVQMAKSHKNQEDETEEDNSRTALICGVTVGGVALFALVFFATRYYKKRRGSFKGMKKVPNGGGEDEVEFRPLNHKEGNIYEDPDIRPTNGIYRPGPGQTPLPEWRVEKEDANDVYAVPDKARKAPLLGRPPVTEELSQSPSAQEPLISGVDKLKYIDDSTDDEYVNTARDRLLPSWSPASRLTNVVEETPPATPSISQSSRPKWSPSQSNSESSNNHKNGASPKQADYSLPNQGSFSTDVINNLSNQNDGKFDNNFQSEAFIPIDNEVKC